MALGQVEFTLLASVLVAYIIFTPEPLVLLRNLSAWAILTWLAWYGYQHWETSPRTRRLVHGIYNDRAISTIIELYWHQALGALGSWGTKSVGTTCTRAVVGLASIFGFGWPQSDGTASDTTTKSKGTFLRHTKYYAILVTTPPVHIYGPVSDHLHTAPDRSEKIMWNSTSPDSIPPMLASLAFRRHFALCLVPQGVWESKTKTLTEKFDGQVFWDYSGDEPDNSRAVAWPPSRISDINAIQELGIIDSDGDAVATCTSHYNQLREDWEYFNIWWNDADFAIILACLVDESAVSICRVLMRRRDELRETEVTKPRQASGRTATFMTMAAAGGLMVMTGGLAAPVAGPLFAAAGASHLAQDVLTTKEALRRSQRMASSDQLQVRFPRLRQLFA
ncbi:hypothetical protein BGZ61DRAFT_127063 [Ilyonectria robusta]|uniref:uncharacterized protein n=1 Tax=Ilyonectria robusta TaxID=1079257 RepID=UPI001E8D1D66|nr:uncharacterized protein BGZ61DRAFT_127063 [Ilyonectria robusta]KAH8734616.1 hypothetical protein BGZ61DRAFT_127063 [Ilyonectria robusta]